MKSTNSFSNSNIHFSWATGMVKTLCSLLFPKGLFRNIGSQSVGPFFCFYSRQGDWMMAFMFVSYGFPIESEIYSDANHSSANRFFFISA